MADMTVRRFFMKNDPVVAGQITEWFHKKVVFSYSFGYANPFPVTESGIMYVRVTQGCVLFSRDEDFRECYIIPAMAMVFIETDARITYGDKKGFFVLMTVDN